MAHIYIALTILLTVYGQVVIKWQVSMAKAFPDEIVDKFFFLTGLLLNPWILSGFAAAFLAALSWMAAMSKLPLSYAYPFMSLAFVLVFILSVLLFKESVTPYKLIGTGLIVAGIVINSQA